MLNKTKIALAALLLAASAAGASAQTAGAAYEPTGTGQGMWMPAGHPAGHSHAAAVRAPVVHEGPNTVIEAGHYLGQDPDPTVRMMLERDLSWQ
ncbi:MAG: hypothetical protein ABWY35_02495 [Pseudorhodoplanes sp.]